MFPFTLQSRMAKHFQVLLAEFTAVFCGYRCLRKRKGDDNPILGSSVNIERVKTMCVRIESEKLY